MTIFDLQQKLQSGIWAILPEHFDSLKACVEARIKGEKSFYEADPYTETFTEDVSPVGGYALVIPIKGELVQAGDTPLDKCSEYGIANTDYIHESIEFAAGEESISLIIL